MCNQNPRVDTPCIVSWPEMGCPESRGQHAAPRAAWTPPFIWNLQNPEDFPCTHFTCTFRQTCVSAHVALPTHRHIYIGTHVPLTQMSSPFPSANLSHTQTLPFTHVNPHSPMVSSLGVLVRLFVSFLGCPFPLL